QLGARQLLLVLDNCEQVLEIGPQLVEVLAACPNVKLLATSREPLGLRWEHLRAVPPLLLPRLAQLPAASALASTPAVALFVERACAADPAFELTDENA